MERSIHSLAREKVPGRLRYKPGGRARFRIERKVQYLGPYGSEGSWIVHGNLIAQYASCVPVDPLRGGQPVRLEVQ
jgi:hypothetical protein